MNKTAQIDQYLKSKKVTADTKITLALLIELLDGFKPSTPKWVRADEFIAEMKETLETCLPEFKTGIQHAILRASTYLDETGNVSPQAAENVDGLTKQMVIDFLDWTQKRKGEQLDELMEKENDEFTAYIETIGIETSSQLFDLYFSAPLSPVPVKEEGRFYTTDEVWKMYSEDPAYGYKSYKEFAEENGWVMVKLSPAPTPTEEQDKEVKDTDIVESLRESFYKQTGRRANGESIDRAEYILWLETKIVDYKSMPSPLPLADISKMAEEAFNKFDTVSNRLGGNPNSHRKYFIAGYTATNKVEKKKPVTIESLHSNYWFEMNIKPSPDHYAQWLENKIITSEDR